ncbi:MAG: alkane 1-monooxygenase [Planctomycetota bacterium]
MLKIEQYKILRNFDESPQMPAGYPGMMLLSLFPPLRFNVMHKKIVEYKTKLEGKELG